MADVLTMATRTNPPAGLIELREVQKSCDRGAAARKVVEDCSFTAEADRFTVMIGPSGTGRSTLARLIAGFDRPDGGEILVGGRPVAGPGRDRLVVFQESALFPWMNTEENIAYGPKANGLWSLCQEAPRTNRFITTDIDEAIFFADRLLVISQLPASVRAVNEVDLPRPRNLAALIRDDRGNAIKMEALSLLHEEALKAFTRGSKAAAAFIDAFRHRLGAERARRLDAQGAELAHARYGSSAVNHLLIQKRWTSSTNHMQLTISAV